MKAFRIFVTIVVALIFMAGVAQSATLKVKAPNGGETWAQGSTHDITWDYSGATGSVKIVLIQGTAKIGVIAPSVPIQNKKYSWKAGNYEGGAAAAGSDYKIKIVWQVSAEQRIEDMSNSTFTIAALATLLKSTAEKTQVVQKPPIQQPLPKTPPPGEGAIGETKIVQKPPVPISQQASSKEQLKVQPTALSSIMEIMTTPKITWVFPLPIISPEEAFILMGSGFGDRKGILRVIGDFLEGPFEVNKIDDWKDDVIVGWIKPLEGVKDHTAKFQVTTSDGKLSNEFPVKFEATRVFAMFRRTDITVIQCDKTTDDVANICNALGSMGWSVGGFHQNKHAGDRTGLDIYEGRLKNGWIFDGQIYDWWYSGAPETLLESGDSTAKVHLFLESDEVARLVVDWFVPSCGGICLDEYIDYVGQLGIIGPKGVPWR